MRKLFITCVLFLFCFSAIWAQHCPFDNISIIIVQVIDAETGEIRKDVTPFLDFRGISGRDKIWLSNAEGKFFENPEKTDKNWRSNYNYEAIHFYFAKENFILLVSEEVLKKKPVIKFKNNAGKILKKKYAVESKDVFSIHGNFPETWVDFDKKNGHPLPVTPFTHTILISL